MRTLSLRSLIRLIKSMPLPVLREISTTATSGRVSVTRRRASLMSAASPQTSRSGCLPIRKAKASRTAGWSSTMRTRLRLLGLVRRIVLPRQHARHDRTCRFGGLEVQARADDRGTVTHDTQTHTRLLCGPGWHADAVVL